MSRITKSIAEAVASHLVQSKNDELKSIRQQKSEFVRSIYIDQLPDGLLKSFKAFKDYFRTQTGIYLSGAGLSQTYRTYSVGEALPTTSNDRMVLNEIQAKQIVNLDNKEDDKKKEISELRTNIEAALFNLRTYNNVEKEFPEAFKLLPPTQVNTGLMINIKDIRCKLDAANCN